MRLVTWNVHSCIGVDNRLDVARVADVLRELDADVVGLQEVDRDYSPRSEFADQTRLLADALGVSGFFAPALRHPDGGGYGIALLSKEEPTSYRVVDLPWTDDGDHGELRVCIEAAYGDLTVLVTHLQWLPAGDRVPQWAAVRELVTSRTVVLADLNDDPAALATTAGLVDAGRAAGPTWRADRLRSRLDAVLTSPGLEVERTWVVQTPASDHLPLAVELA